jgi:hypothetical protein
LPVLYLIYSKFQKLLLLETNWRHIWQERAVSHTYKNILKSIFVYMYLRLYI